MRMILTSTVGGPMEFTLRLIGVWPDSSCKLPQRVVWTTLMVMSQLFQYWYLFAHIGSDTLAKLMQSLSLCLSNTLLFLKMSILWLNGRILYDMLATMADDWNEFTSACSKTRMMTSKAALSRRLSKCTLGVYTACILLFGASNMMARADSEQAADEERELIVKMELPFDYTASPFYEIIMIAQFLLQYTCALLAGMLNALIVTFILHVAGQIDVMCYELLGIPAAEEKRDSRVVALRAVITRHQRIIAFADGIEDVFCYMSLIQFFSNTFVICFLGFVIVASLGTAEGNVLLVTVIPYYIVVNLEAFVICFTGEYLSSKSKSITRAAYDSCWYELKPSESRLLLLLIVKSQRQLSITIGKFMDLSLESFTAIVKASASYVSVLHAMY